MNTYKLEYVVNNIIKFVSNQEVNIWFESDEYLMDIFQIWIKK